MFFSDIKTGTSFLFPTKIERAYMDGSQRKVLVTKKLYNPQGLTLDYSNQRLYWTDVHMNQIETVTYDGNDRYGLLVSTGRVFSLGQVECSR